jgi:hypothetical protein
MGLSASRVPARQAVCSASVQCLSSFCQVNVRYPSSVYSKQIPTVWSAFMDDRLKDILDALPTKSPRSRLEPYPNSSRNSAAGVARTEISRAYSRRNATSRCRPAEFTISFGLAHGASKSLPGELLKARSHRWRHLPLHKLKRQHPPPRPTLQWMQSGERLQHSKLGSPYRTDPGDLPLRFE